MSYAHWIARIEAELASPVDPEAWRGAYERGLSPAEAVHESREEVA